MIINGVEVIPLPVDYDLGEYVDTYPFRVNGSLKFISKYTKGWNFNSDWWDVAKDGITIIKKEGPLKISLKDYQRIIAAG